MIVRACICQTVLIYFYRRSHKPSSDNIAKFLSVDLVVVVVTTRCQFNLNPHTHTHTHTHTRTQCFCLINFSDISNSFLCGIPPPINE